MRKSRKELKMFVRLIRSESFSTPSGGVILQQLTVKTFQLEKILTQKAVDLWPTVLPCIQRSYSDLTNI